MTDKEKRELDAALRAFLGLSADVPMVTRIIYNNGPDEIEGLTNTIPGVRTQCEYATLEARLMERQYNEVPE